jgi:hypothetical protein
MLEQIKNTNQFKRGTLGWVREQQRVKAEREAKTNKVQCSICNDYFQKEDDLDDDICDSCWILVNK